MALCHHACPSRFLFLLAVFAIPILFFATAIVAGAALLRAPFCLTGAPLAWIDALFTATSATCVTGLTVVDTGTTFSQAGQTVIMILIQVGGLGIMTFASLFFYLVNHRVSLNDRIMIGKSLLHDPNFHLGSFLLLAMAVALVFGSTFVMTITEGGVLPDPLNRGQFLEILFETVSAFGTVGLSTGITPKLTVAGKMVIIGLMFVGRLGPILFIAAIQNFQKEPLYSWPQEEMLVG